MLRTAGRRYGAAMAIDLGTVAEHERALFGGDPTVDRFYADDDSLWVDVLRSPDSPVDGITSHATIGTSRFDNQLVSDGLSIRVELLGACASEVSEFADMLCSCALTVAHGEHSAVPGAIFTGIVERHLPGVSMKHMLFVTPYLWGDGPDALADDEHVLAWLMAVPVSDSELGYAREHGTDALQALFERAEIDVLDIDRPPVT
jgi:hypothetical protein